MKKKKFREVYFDGSNGWSLGNIIEAEPDEDGKILHPGDDGTEEEFKSAKKDGLYQNEDGSTLLVPLDPML